MPIRARKSLAAVFILIAAVCAGLGMWQLDRLRGRRAANAVAAAKRSLPVLALGTGTHPADSSLAGRRVSATGRFDHGGEIVLRGQVLDGVPGIHLVTPLLLDGSDTALLVNRGFVPSPDAVTAPAPESLREGGTVRVEGIALPIERNHGGHPIMHDGRTSWARLDLDALEDSLPYPVFGVYVRRLATGAATPSFPRALAAPPLGDGPHLSYALQWFGFVAVAVVFAGVVWRKRV